MAGKLRDGGRQHLLRGMAMMIMVALFGSVSTYNLDTDLAQVFLDPNPGSNPNRSSYFGFSVALQRRHDDGSAWLVVGAPRANSSYYNPRGITEPGVVYKCSIVSGGSCSELFIDRTGNTDSGSQDADFLWQDLKNEGWLGASLDTQPTFEEGRQATAVCAPRWRNQVYSSTYLMNGACYWLNSSLPDAPAHKKLPLLERRKQTYSVGKRALFYYSHGEAGMSVHFPDDPTEMIIGAPGVFNWQGTVIRYKDSEGFIPGDVSRRRRRQAFIGENQMFSTKITPNPYYTAKIITDFDLMGYAVTSGRFLSRDQLLYASGAPRGASSLGKVIIFSFPYNDEQQFTIHAEWQGEQLGENFGAAVVAADVNGDGLSDLIVGSPMYGFSDTPDVGRISVFLSTRGTIEKSRTRSLGSSTSFARFGTTLASLGDLNNDQYEDIAVGAPWEGNGAVYIFMGSAGGLLSSYSQRLLPEQVSAGLSGFGMALSRGIDVDGNYYNDLAIGSFLSGHAVVIKSRPVASVSGFIVSTPSTIDLNSTSLQISACIDYKGYKVPRHVRIKGNITLDHGFPAPRASFADIKNVFKEFNELATFDETKCAPFDVQVKRDKVDPRKPIVMKMEYEISEPETSYDKTVQPIMDLGVKTTATSAVGIVTGCEIDGNDICSTDMRVEMKFAESGAMMDYVIGSDKKLVLRVEVYNLGEPVFLPNVTLKVVLPLALYMPSSHTCDFAKPDRTALTCQLTNPIQDQKDFVDVELDVSQLTDESHNLAVDVEVAGEGVEIRPSDNVISQELHLKAQADLTIQGLSEEEQLLYHRIKVDAINTTNPMVFQHHYSVMKTGPTPLGQVELIVEIPVNFTDGSDIQRSFVEIYSPSSTFIGQPVLCTISGATFSLDKDNNGNADDVDLQLTRNGTESNSKDDDYEYIENIRPLTENSGNTQTAAIKEVQIFNCSRADISCAKLRCPVNHWPSGSKAVTVSFKLQVDLRILAGYMSAQAGAVFETNGIASIKSINSDIDFTGQRVASAIVKTYFQPDSLPGRGVPWWIILLAVLGGLLLLILLAYGLYKAGFFKRKEQEQLKAHQAQIASSEGYGAVNPGAVGD